MTSEIERTFPASMEAWNMETGAGADKTAATMGEVMSALSDPEFQAAVRNSPELNATIRDMRQDGTTEAELGRFDEQLHNVGGALDAFENALYRIAPRLAPEPEEPAPLDGGR